MNALLSYEPIDWIAQWATLSPHAVAVIDFESNTEYTYKTLFKKAQHVASYFQSIGICKGDRVAIVALNSIEHFILFAVALQMGIILVPVNFRLAAAEVDYILTDCVPRIVFADDDHLQLLNSCTYQAEFGIRTIAELHTYTPNNSISPTTIHGTDPVFIMYTSGTTGFPKGALYTHQMMFWNSINTTIRLDIQSSDKTITCLPLFHTGGWNVLTTPFLHRGATIILMKKFDAATVLLELERAQCTIFMAVPTLLSMMAESAAFKKVQLSSVRYFIVGGEALPLQTIELWHNKGIMIRQGYGLTEVGPNITSLHHTDAKRKIGSIGLPNFYVQTRIEKEDGLEANVGEPGELLLKGNVATPGYWNNTAETAKAYSNGWFRTGDIVQKDSEGFLYVVDRKKSMYISGGENVYPAEVERMLYAMPHIAECAVVGIPDEQWGECGVAFIVLHPSSTCSLESIQEHARKNIAKFKVPKHIVVLEKLPKNETGKINKKELKAQYLSTHSTKVGG